VETAQPLIDAKGQELLVSLPDQPIFLDGDLVRLTQVISNLLVNATKYTDRAGQIRLSGERAGSEVVIRVRDTGVGIDPALLTQVFELFVQADRSLDRAQGGLGVGLTLVQRLVELHHGSVMATSPGLGQGSEFCVRLPALPEGQAADSETAEPPLPAKNSPRRVLVVDDNQDAAESTAVLLRLLGHEVQVAHDGPAALSVVPQFHPDIVLLDIGLPGMDGYEVARALRAQPQLRGLVLVAVTGYGQDEDRRQALAAGFDRHLTKPLAPQVLTALVSAS
jgi:two-component system CheB/CheR fusion protein